MGIAAVTVHGFRSSFTDWAAEITSFKKEIVEKAPAPAVPTAVEAAYRRTHYFAARDHLLEAWSAHVAGKTA